MPLLRSSSSIIFASVGPLVAIISRASSSGRSFSFIMMPPLTDQLCIGSTDKITFRISELFGKPDNLLVRRTFNLEVIPCFSLIQRDAETVLLENCAVLRILGPDLKADFFKNAQQYIRVFHPALDLLAMFQFRRRGDRTLVGDSLAGRGFADTQLAKLIGNGFGILDDKFDFNLFHAAVSRRPA